MNAKIFFCAATLLCAACTDKPLVDADTVPPPPQPARMTLRASASPLATESRTSFDEAGVLVWRNGDAIGVFSDLDANNTRFTLDGASAAHAEGEFTGTQIEGSAFYAYYPYGTATLTGRTLTFSLPDMQTGTPGNFTAGQNPMVAYGTDENLYFRSVCGVVKLKITGTHVLRRIAFRGNGNEPVAGKASVAMDYTDAPELELQTGSSTVTLDLGEQGIQLTDTPQEFLVVVPARTYATGFTVTLTDLDGRSAVRSTDRPVTVARSTIKPMAPFEAEFLVVWSDTENLLTNLTMQPPADATDLTAALANCYVISRAGSYKIPNRLNDGTEVSAQPFLGFTATGAVGNAVIAVEDETGKILWSWHIWCTGAAAPTAVAIGSYSYLDRNLGATATGSDAGAHAYGCFYQWGRKDPFPRNGLHNGQSLDRVALPLGRIYAAETTATVAQTAAYPNAFFYTPQQNDWNTGHADDLWIADTKTTFDPCPAGYEVPSIDQLSDLVAQPLTPGTDGCTIGGSWFPTAGFCEAVVPIVLATGTGGYGWSTEAIRSQNGSRIFYLAQNYGTTPTRAFASTPGIGYDRGYGLSVRCVKAQ